MEKTKKPSRQKVYTLLVQDALNEFVYAAEIAGLSYSLMHSVTGMTLTFGGFNHKIDKLVEKVIGTLLSPDITEEHFERADRVRSEYVLKVTGRVRARSEATVNASMPTGDIEVLGKELTKLPK